MNICVFCSSSRALAQPYLDAARQLGESIANRADTLVYGGADSGWNIVFV